MGQKQRQKWQNSRSRILLDHLIASSNTQTTVTMATIVQNNSRAISAIGVLLLVAFALLKFYLPIVCFAQ